jgi:predicted DNA-binding transcriptional regulator AlpA
MNTQLIRVKNVEKLLGISTNTFLKLRRDKESNFPKPFYIFNKILRWGVADILKWIDKKENA